MEIEVKGRKLKVTVDDGGLFRAVFDANEYRAETLKGLKEKLARILSEESKRAAIPFYRKNNRNAYDYRESHGLLRRGTLIGIHGGNGNLLVKWDGTKTSDQVGFYYSDTTGFLALTDSEVPRFEEIIRAYDAAKATLDKFEKDHAFNPRKALEDEFARQDKQEAST